MPNSDLFILMCLGFGAAEVLKIRYIHYHLSSVICFYKNSSKCATALTGSYYYFFLKFTFCRILFFTFCRCFENGFGHIIMHYQLCWRVLPMGMILNWQSNCGHGNHGFRGGCPHWMEVFHIQSNNLPDN